MRLVKVVTPDEGIGVGTKVTDLETGQDVPSVVAIEVPRFSAKDPIRVNIELFSAAEIVGVPCFMVGDPRTGTPRAVKSITFADGETVEF
ncbi:hypothetical protein MPL3356_60511 [Mesorhizobium plurifarium]|uniref:Uncharacterized protein n=1 Tax=Mesorhizobium plurifarium TaxID=69974 RepID=A0A090E9V1_MESPL|nr:hypothetical protein MPL3356_60511 [Mesorhizobium plurifarium]